jgi:hypothetical protein
MKRRRTDITVSGGAEEKRRGGDLIDSATQSTLASLASATARDG